jgi:hypothetical protein
VIAGMARAPNSADIRTAVIIAGGAVMATGSW